jgi:hypothetical protein
VSDNQLVHSEGYWTGFPFTHHPTTMQSAHRPEGASSSVAALLSLFAVVGVNGDVDRADGRALRGRVGR